MFPKIQGKKKTCFLPVFFTKKQRKHPAFQRPPSAFFGRPRRGEHIVCERGGLGRRGMWQGLSRQLHDSWKEKPVGGKDGGVVRVFGFSSFFKAVV